MNEEEKLIEASQRAAAAMRAASDAVLRMGQAALWTGAALDSLMGRLLVERVW